MRAVFNRKALLEAFNMVSGVVPSRSPKPILQNVKLIVDNGETTLVGTDLEVGVRRVVLGVNARDDGEVILPTDRVGQILRTSADEEISIETDGEKLVVKGQRSRFSLPNEDPALFPDVPGFDSENYMVLIDTDLKKLIRRTSFATDMNSNRYALGGVLVERNSDSVVFIGTDGRRLARATVPAELVGETDESLPVIPLKALKLIDKALAGDGDQVHLGIIRNASAMIRSSDTTICTRLVEGRFPRYEDAIPKTKNYSIPLDVATFRAANEQSSIITSEESRGVLYKFSSDGVELCSNAADVGESKIDLPLLGSIEGAGVSVSMDPKYVADALRTLDTDEPLSVDLIDEKNAVKFMSGDSYTYIVMPLTK